MRRLISPSAMRQSEREYFQETDASSLCAMERAAEALCDGVCTHFPSARRVFIACGPGENGGDGYACARLLREKGLDAHIFEIGEAKSSDAIENRRRAVESGVPFGGGGDADVWVDCLYGTGLSRAPEGEAARLIERINASGAGVVSADIPSGLNGETGVAYASCVRADLTVCFQLFKYGHWLNDGLERCGKIVLADVGFPENIFPQNLPRFFEPDDLPAHFERRERTRHKGQNGHVLIIAGSRGMAGAAMLCARAALRSGAGLVSVACPEEIAPLMQSCVPCALCIALPQQNGHISKAALPQLQAALKGKTALVIGPGLSTFVPPEVIEWVLDSGIKALIDADALNIIAAHGDLTAHLNQNHVLTPHIGEAARLLGRRIAHPMNDAPLLSQNGCCVVLKSASRVITDGNLRRVSASGDCAMAKGGSGDVLSGILGAILAEPSRRSVLESACCACEIHGLCGELAAGKYGARAANAEDLIEFLPEVLKKYAP